MDHLNCIIVEDEELPRLSLKAKLETYHPEIEILEMCDTCESALECILRLKPQIVFLDIQLPDNTSIWLLEQLQKSNIKLPQIIFTTAYTDTEYLLKAIKLDAVDYLNKPVNLIELAHAVEKTKVRLSDNAKLSPQKDSNLSFKVLNGHLIITPDEIVYIQADGNYSTMRLTNGKEETIFERLGEIEKKINNNMIIRAGRSILLNRRYIRKLNSKKTLCTLVVGNESYTLKIPQNSLSELLDDIQQNKV